MGERRYNSAISELGANRGEWWTSRPSRFTPGERVRDTDYMGYCESPRAGLDAVKKITIFAPAGNRTPPLDRLHIGWGIGAYTGINV
jgi:hypothetical protein